MKHLYLLSALIMVLFISACGGGGDSAPAATAPAAPAGVAVTAGNTQITPGWTAVAGATSYNVYYRTSAGVTIANGTKVANAASGTPITGLANGTAYFVAVTALSASGESTLSSEASATPAAPPAAPGAPTGITVASGNAQVALIWPIVTSATSYNVYYSNTTGVSIANGTKIANTTSGTAITGLTNSTTYYFVVTAANAGGESAVSSEVNATPQVPVVAPVAPTGVSAAAGNTQATISWTAVTGSTSYNVYYGAAAGVTTANGTKVTGAISGAAITALANGTAYYFVVTAVNAAGESIVSSEVSSTPQTPAISFGMVDLVGTWDRHRLQAGRTFTDIATGAITSVSCKWNYGIETWDSGGNATGVSELSSDGSTTLGVPTTLSISTNGIITDSVDPSYHGTMSGSKDLVVGTRTAGNGIDPRLIILQKQNPAIIFATADLAGTWDRHFLRAGRTFTDITTGAITSMTNKWEHGVETWDASGNFTEISGAWSEAGAYVLSSGIQSVSASGIITDPAAPTFYGIMSASKDLVVSTKTAGNGIDVTFAVFQKQDPAIAFTTADLAGTWNRHSIRVGRTFTDVATGAITGTTNRWDHGVETWDASGNATEVAGTSASSDGSTPPASYLPWSISASGIITTTDPSLHGTMSASKDLVVVTKTAGNGIDVLMVIFQRN